jgi:hypothetical protein
MAYDDDDNYVGDDIDRLIDQAAGVGAATPSRPRGAAGATRMQRSDRTVGKRAPLGFGAFSLAAAASVTLTATVQRPFMADRLLVTASQTGVLVTSIKVGDEEQILGGSCPQELYGPSALADSRPDDFTPAPAGIQLAVTLTNGAASTTTGSVGMKGSVRR